MNSSKHELHYRDLSRSMNGPSTLGRTNLYSTTEWGARNQDHILAKLRNNNQINFNKEGARFTSVGPHTSFSKQLFEDLWSAQVIASWLTDFNVWKNDFPQQVGLVSSQGKSPSDIKLLRPQNGVVISDLSSVLVKHPQMRSIMGPDGIFGKATDDLLSEYVRTGNVFGKVVPTEGKPAFERLISSITSPRIESAKREKSAGQTAAREAASRMDDSQISGDAQINSGREKTKPAYSLGETWSYNLPRIKPIKFKPILAFDFLPTGTFSGADSTPSAPSPTNSRPSASSPTNSRPSRPTTSRPAAPTTTKTIATDKTSKEEEEDSVTVATTLDDTTLLLISGVALAALLGGLGYLVYKKRQR